MRSPGVLHLVDTLEPGGTERVAVNLVNHLSRERFRPFLGTTRREGALASEVWIGDPRPVIRLELRPTFEAGGVVTLEAGTAIEGEQRIVCQVQKGSQLQPLAVVPVSQGAWGPVTLPLLVSPAGLPLGVQLVGRRDNDARLLRTAHWLEATLAVPGRRRRPAAGASRRAQAPFTRQRKRA